MRYVIVDDLGDPDVLVQVDRNEVVTTLRREFTGHQEFIDALRRLISEYREEIWSEHQIERAGVPVDVVDRREHLARMDHANLLCCAARAIEMELFQQ